MSKISRVYSTAISRVNRLESVVTREDQGFFIFREYFNFYELGLDEGSKVSCCENNEDLRDILINILNKVIIDGCSIKVRGALSNGVTKIEASFKIPNRYNEEPTIYLPLKGVARDEVIPAVRHVLSGARDSALSKVVHVVEQMEQRSGRADFIKLIIILAHEFGHFQSYLRGNHSAKLRLGLEGLYSRRLDENFAYEVFAEEVVAWMIAEEELRVQSFEYFEEFIKIKRSSLRVYFDMLNLKSASLEIYYRLSTLPVDLKFA